MERFDEVSTRVFDNGMEYEVVRFKLRNRPENIANGGKPVIDQIEVFKIKKNGQRGMKLSGFATRKFGVINAK